MAKPAPHFHVLTPALQTRIALGRPAQMAANLDALAIYRRKNGRVGGTGFLLTEPASDGTALMITNHHVALFEKNSVDGDAFLFHPGGNTTAPVAAEVVQAVASNLEFDYALLLVKLPESLRGLRAVRLDGRRDLSADERIYNPSFPRMHVDEKFTPKQIQVGWTEAAEYEGLHELRLPHKDGSSGSPVFSSETHDLVALMNAGDGRWMALARPIGRILKHLKANLQNIESAPTRDRVSDLVDEVRR